VDCPFGQQSGSPEAGRRDRAEYGNETERVIPARRVVLVVHAVLGETVEDTSLYVGRPWLVAFAGLFAIARVSVASKHSAESMGKLARVVNV
jgi:hypothetical protein